MDDFLGNLVARSLGLAPVIHPRSISRFEPSPANGALDTAGHSFDAQVETGGAVARVVTALPEQPAKASTPYTQRTSDLLITAHQEQPAQASTPEAPRVPRLQPPPSPESKSAATVRREWMPGPIAQEPSGRERDVVGGVMAQASAARTSAARDVGPVAGIPAIYGVERIIPAERELEPPAAAKVGVNTSRAGARPVPVPIVERVIIERERTDQDREAQPMSPRPVIAPMIEQVRTPDRDQAARAASTIHVTIGRIEVRAAPPPAPPKRAAPAAATMSLEDYLRSQAGNKR